LTGGKVFDVNTETGDVITYVPSKHERQDIEGLEEADKIAPSKAKTYDIVISEDGNRLAFNNTTIEKTADGAVAVATDGVSQIKPANQSPSAVAAEEAKIGQPVKPGWLYLTTTLDNKEVTLIADEDLGLMDRKKAKRVIEKLRRENPTIEL